MHALTLERVTEEAFTFTPEGEAEPISIWSGRLREWLLANAMDKVTPLIFPEETEAELIKRHGLEAPRMASLTEEEASEPVVVGMMPDGTAVLIDGGHRRWFWAKRGVNTIKGWAVPEEVWKLFVADFDDPNLIVLEHAADGAKLPQRQGKGSE